MALPVGHMQARGFLNRLVAVTGGPPGHLAIAQGLSPPALPWNPCLLPQPGHVPQVGLGLAMAH